MIRDSRRIRIGGRARLAAVGVVMVVAFACLPFMVQAATPAPLQSFDTAKAVPRSVEDATALAVQRDYSHAWQSLIAALQQNRANLLDEDFTGGARQQWQEAIRSQSQNGLSRHIVDHGHKLRVTFYSLDGSALEAIDAADLEIQYREGDKLLSSERVQSSFLVLLTPSENSWKIRALQEVSPR